jgi:hypothetical protein
MIKHPELHLYAPFKNGYVPSKTISQYKAIHEYIKDEQAFLAHAPEIHWGDGVKVPWPMWRNGPDPSSKPPCGDCVPVAAGHLVMAYTGAAGDLFVPTTDDIIKVYSDVTGFDDSQWDSQGNNPTDNGTQPIDLLNYWKSAGIAGHKIGAFVKGYPQNINHIKAGIAWFGGAFTAITVYQFMEDQFNAGADWKVPDGAAISDSKALGGHGVPLIGFLPDPPVRPPYGDFDLITWAKSVLTSYNAFWGISVEVWFPISLDWVQGGKSPNGFDMEQLLADLQLVQARDSGN